MTPPLIPFYPGDGTEVPILVDHIDEYARGTDGTCAFCHGDPCAEDSPQDSPIWQYMHNHAYAPATCPCCDGRPT